VLRPDLPTRSHTVALGKSDVENGDIRIEGGDLKHGIVLRARLADDRDVALGLEQIANAPPNDLVIIE
jgi:hypothetical protein